MSKHTPGPWEQVPQMQGGPIIANRYETGRQLNPTGLRLVCHVLQRRSSLREDEANARLIAASPGLLKALKGARDRIESERSSGEIDPLLEEIDAAIAKAEGRE